MTITHLDALTFPLRGSRLIEASAGTGKTFTIAALYVRLVLGHGLSQADAPTAFNRPLTPPEILVVTFTDAATKELRSRIRERLAQAAAYFYAGTNITDTANTKAQNADEFLSQLRHSYPPNTWASHARKLQIAADWMDEAAISTIHGWCNRMLREHAFNSESLFTQRLEQDHQELLEEVARDYWRTFMYPLAHKAAADIMECWNSPDALLSDLQNLLPHAEQFAGSITPDQSIDEAQKALNQLKAPWHEWLDQLLTLIEDARIKKQFDARKLSTKNATNWLQNIQDWRDNPALRLPPLTKPAWERLTPEGMKEIWHDKALAPTHPALQALADLRQQVPRIQKPILGHAAHWIANRFEFEQTRRAEMGFDGLLTRLDAALQGPHGAKLAAVIRQQFPVAMIDEFQDTDAIQYRIFDAVYQLNTNSGQTATILIGDPKQAIYSFRGADIYTYLRAKSAVDNRLYSLPINYRSTAAMVNATNRCFELAENRPHSLTHKGAFLFRQGDNNPVPFVAVTAQGRSDALVVEGNTHAALNLWRMSAPSDGKKLTKEAYTQQMADICAREMARLLKLGEKGVAGFDAADTSPQLPVRAPLRPADMAVLVNTRQEAKAIRAALARHQVRSVYLSEGESVYARPEAQDLRIWLMACAQPDNSSTLRAALATRTLQQDWATLERLNQDEIVWDEMLRQFHAYRETWRKQGVLPMLRRILHDFQVPARLLTWGEGGERSLTDILHLAELLQQASTVLEGEQALIGHLTELMQEKDQKNTPHTIRLESDANLVKVVTIHKSKGLEYPLVFVPFICNARQTKASDIPLKYHTPEGKLKLALEPDAPILQWANEERLAEDVRKLYVALTRARYATWLGLAPIADFSDSGLGYLLDGRYQEGSDELAADRTCVNIMDMAPEEPADATELAPAPHAIEIPPTKAWGPARQAQRNLHEYWQMASYSTMRYQTAADSAQEAIFHEVASDESAALAPSLSESHTPSSGLLHGFPRGTAAGTFLHELMEWACHEGFGHLVQFPNKVHETVLKRCQSRQWDEMAQHLSNWLLSYIQMPITSAVGTCFSLAKVPTKSTVVEMEFWLSVHHVSIEHLDRLVCEHTLDAAERPALEPKHLHGMLKGFIDLVLEHDGRYYVVDYKSNYLGATDSAYTAQAMKEAILKSRYELQYVLYLLAVHRLLKLRLPDYDYDQHMGGAIYLFLRGDQAPTRGIHAERPPRELIEALDQLFTAPHAQDAA